MILDALGKPFDSQLARWVGKPWPPEWWKCCNCEQCIDYDPCGSAAPATAGTVGSESGDECTTCTNQIISDDFSGDLDDWTAFCGGVKGNPGFYIDSGELVSNQNSTASLVRSFQRPALAGLCIEVKATIVARGSTSPGIVLALGRIFRQEITTGQYNRWANISAQGCISFGFADIATTHANGDVISMTFRDQGGADGICSICYKVNGAVVRVEEDVQCCFPCTMYAGVWRASNNNVPCRWDDFELRTS